jgi:hypothetical protein
VVRRGKIRAIWLEWLSVFLGSKQFSRLITLFMANDSSDAFRSVPNDAENLGNLPQPSEPFRIVRKDSEERERHTLTVREVARLFESAGVGRTERSITNWCQPNKTGIARLSAYFDPNERRYFITPESVEAAIQEELAREKIKAGDMARSIDPSGNERADASASDDAPGSNEVATLQQEILDLKIMNRGKDYFIGELRKEREAFSDERQRYVEDLMRSNRHIGELELKLSQIEAPRESHIIEHHSAADGHIG